ncbi:hypothetical protein CS063_02605 [Sporanaerobium hydrogeniformans]|uniref:Uncharacterized protein n=1 Tax=Sporanaerobium hydrogeniformans TaxID=3072179 RepID=A0AC61DHX5_9FIRM|nr:hypothetical protein [Sporanaerobium hydrogeniformans]PHV72387.1 hypothetical protein CS063_02605 [Sporanaerobium hydrogeniformans]
MKKEEKKMHKEQPRELETKGSPLLERYIQRSLSDKMQQVDEQMIAEAIKTLLYEDKNQSKHLN